MFRCEIDEMVVDVSKKFLPHMASSFSHPKLQLFIGDGFEFLKNHQNEYDVIITGKLTDKYALSHI